jgi:hypothetical protein
VSPAVSTLLTMCALGAVFEFRRRWKDKRNFRHVQVLERARDGTLLSMNVFTDLTNDELREWLCVKGECIIVELPR